MIPHGRDDVALVRTNGDVPAAVDRLLAELGGLRRIIAGRSRVVIKPNFVAGRPARTGATTDLDLIAAVAAAVRAAGAHPVLCEAPGTEFDLASTYSILGIEEFCRSHHIELAPPGTDWIELRPPGARRLKRFSVPAVLADACLINLPVLKTHVVSGMSIAMKNLMGLLRREDRRSMHTLGISQSIVDMNSGIRPDLTIVDASVGQDGEGPLYGRAARLGLLVGGVDSLAIDLACCGLVGVDPSAIGHLRLAQDQLGPRTPRLFGDEPPTVPSFELPRVNPMYRLAFWLMYPLDYPFHSVTGRHLCTAVYDTGLVGTRPHIVEARCTDCGRCVETCPIPSTIDLSRRRIRPDLCQRCLLCWEACPEGAIEVKGMSGAAPSAAVPIGIAAK